MKILVVGTGGALAGSGITTAADQMARTLGAMGHQPVRHVAGTKLRRRPSRLNLENVIAAATEAVDVALAARRSRVDLVWLHTFGVPTLPAVRALAHVVAVRLARRRVIVRFHAFALEDQLSSPGPLLTLVLRLTGRLAECLVAEHVSAAAALRATIPHANIEVLHNWVDVPSAPPPLPPAPPFTVVFVGGLIERKGVPQLLAAMRLLNDVPVRLRVVGGAGDEGESAAHALCQSAADLVSGGRVTFVGQLDAAGVGAELVDAHALVLPSRAEGMPLAMLEAMAMGRALVVSDVGNMAEIVQSSACGTLITALDPESISMAIRAAMRDVDELAERGRRAHQTALLRYSSAVAAAALRPLLSRVKS